MGEKIGLQGRRWSFLVFSMLLLVPSGYGQGERGAISGTITDESNAVIPGAQVTAIHSTTDVKAESTTTASGSYVIPLLPPGIYRVTAVKQGFKQTVAENVRVAVGTTTTIDLKLPVGETSQTITVLEETPLLQTTPEVGTDVAPAEAKQWPVFLFDMQRQPADFVFNSLPGSTGGSFQGNINGGQEFGYEVTVEGIPIDSGYTTGGNTDFTPTLESVSEFKLQSVPDARSGGGGSALINYAVKSGGNDLHGSVWEFNTNSAYASKGATANFAGVAKPYNNEHNYGFAVSGPIRKDQTFFFGTWEGGRKVDLPLAGRTDVPITAWRNGDFSQMLGAQIGTDALGRPVYDGQIFDPTTTREVNGELVRDPFQYQGRLNVIDAARFSNISKNITALIAQPLFETIRNNQFETSGIPRSSLWAINVKVDHIFNEKHKISGYYLYSNRIYVNGGGIVPLENPTNGFHEFDEKPQAFRFSEDWTISPNKLNHFSFGYNRFRQFQRSLVVDEDWPEQLGLSGVEGTHFPLITFVEGNGISLRTLGNVRDGMFVNGSFVLKDDFTWIRSKHTFQMGGEYWQYYNHARFESGTSGSFSFNLRETSQPGFGGTGNQFASFLTGAVDEAFRDVYAAHPGFGNKDIAFYFQDSIKVTPKLTVNAGIRWDIPRPRSERFNLTAGFDPNEPNPGADGFKGSLVFLADKGRKSFQESYYRQFAPSFGLAYSINDRTVFRGAYGLNYGAPIARACCRYSYAESFGLISSVNVSRSDAPNGFDPALYWENGMPPFQGQLPIKDPTLQNGNNIAYTLPDSLRQFYYQNWSVGIQRELPFQNSLEVNYVGTKGTRLPIGQAASEYGYLQHLYNTTPIRHLGLGDALYDDISAHPEIPKPYPSFEGTVNQALRPYPQYQNISVTGLNIGSSIYHSLQVQARKRPARGSIGYILAYTFSKTFTNAENSNGYNSYNYQDGLQNLAAERSIAFFSYPHDLKVTTIWDLPFGKDRRFLNRGGIVNAVLGGWTLTGILRYRSGNPLQFVDYGVDSSALFLFYAGWRPDRVSGVDANQKSGGYDLANGTTWINPNAFTRVPTSPGGIPLRPGNTARVLDIYGPWRPSETIGLAKFFTFREGMTFEFRTEFRNAFNRTQRGDPDTDFSSENFGKIFGASGRRTILFSGRFSF